jgi:hypothetical protein
MSTNALTVTSESGQALLLAGREHGDWTIAPPAPEARPRRRWPWVLLLFVVLWGLGSAVLYWPLSTIEQPRLSDPLRERLAVLTVAALLCFLPAVMVTLVVSVVTAPRSKSRVRGHSPRRDGTYGDARFVPLAAEYGKADDVVAASLVYRPEGPGTEVGIVRWDGEDLRLARWSWDQLSRHVLVVGATGSGKTTGVFSHFMLSSRVPWIYQDQKADLPLKGLFPFRPVWGLDTRGHETRSSVWNPLEEIAGPEDVEVLAALLFPDSLDPKHPWIVKGARGIFEGLLKHQPFDNIQDVAWLVEYVGLESLLETLPKGYATIDKVTPLSAYQHQLLDVLKPWSASRVAEVTFGPSSVKLEDFIRDGGYVLCNEDKHLRSPVTLFWGMLLYRLRQRPWGASRLLLLMDEFGDAGAVPNMAQALALYRSKGVGIVAGVQSFGLMRETYGEDTWEAVRDGFGSVMVMAANLPGQLRKEMTEQLGKWTRLHEHRAGNWNAPSLSLSRGGPSLSLGSIGASSSTPTRHAVDLVPIDQWSVWGNARAAIVRGVHATWWVPVSLPMEPAPLGAVKAEILGDWRLQELDRLKRIGEAVRARLPQCVAPAVAASDESRRKLVFS